MEDEPHGDQEDGDTQHAVGDDLVNLVRERQPIHGRAAHHLFDQTADEAVPAVGDDGLSVVAVDAAQVVHAIAGLGQDCASSYH